MSMFYPITYSNAPILKAWSTDMKDVHTGVDLQASDVYSYASGVVLAVGNTDNHYCVTVQYDVFNLLRYDNLKSVSVGAGDVVQSGTLIGIADRFVHFEWATKNKNSSKWSVRVGSQIYWKQNPAEMIYND